MIKGWDSRKPGTLAEHFRMNVRFDCADACWDWTGSKDKDGYGKMRHDGKHLRAHRVSYEIHKGPIPPGKMVCHKCDYPSCVNPAHLFIGDSSTNMIDMVHKARGVRQKLTPSDVKLVRRLLDDGHAPKEIAPVFSVHPHTIRRIRNGKRWGHLAA
jgi:hypothetical protein